MSVKKGREQSLAGQEQVSENADRNHWWSEAYRTLLSVARGSEELTTDQVRKAVEKVCGSPHHGNAWGALFGTAVRSEVIEHTGRIQASAITSNHARRTPIYRSLIFEQAEPEHHEERMLF